MARAIWKGSISFGLVNIPIALYPATRREELKFRLLRKSDLSPVNYRRVAEKDGKEVPWDQIVKGYEYEKGKYVVLKDEDFERVDLEATQTVDIQDFVDVDEIDPMFFYKPYYLEPQKGGDKAYALLRDALKDSNKVGIAKVVIKTRQYLAGVKDRKSIRLNSSHRTISYAVFCFIPFFHLHSFPTRRSSDLSISRTLSMSMKSIRCFSTSHTILSRKKAAIKPMHSCVTR